MDQASTTYPVVGKEAPTIYFVGVATSQSAIMQVFPLWMRELERPDVAIEGIDLRIHDAPRRYRATVAQMKYDALSLGALVTTHKIDLLAAACDMFDYLDPYARICGEVSSISKREGQLEGHAKDPFTAGLSLDAILGPGYFGRTGGNVLCFGAGGAALAIALHLLSRPNPTDRPQALTVVNRSHGRLDGMQRMVEAQSTDIAFRYICNEDPHVNDRLMAALPDGSLVINGTGMGKDSPGSPITDAGQFPARGVAWELNYRGELGFLRQAHRQAAARRLAVEDGWLYFLHGWTQVIAQILHIDLTDATFRRLAEIAAVGTDRAR